MNKEIITFTGFKQPNMQLPYNMHIDMNGFFASCEQQENPLLRGKPIGVVPYLSEGSTILASSYEAKKLGITTGTRVRDAKKVCPNLILKLNDPPKYKYIHYKLMHVLKKFTPSVSAKSIDEAVLSFAKTQIYSDLKKNLPNNNSININSNPTRQEIEKHRKIMTNLANNIKAEIKNRVGDYMRCSIGIATNRFLAKVASNINKPDGLYYLHNSNISAFYDL